MTNQPQLKSNLIERVVQIYGDMLFDFCHSVLWSQSNAHLAFRSILKEIKKQKRTHSYNNYERPWILKIACEKLRSQARKHGRRLTPSEQIMLDATLKTDVRLKQFDSYFHRLSSDDQMLLLLRDKYGLPYNEIAAAMQLPEGSLKVKRQQALRTLEDWVWNQT